MAKKTYGKTPAGWKWNPPLPLDNKSDTFHSKRLIQSSTECTGLMMQVPNTQSEAEASSTLYGIHCAKPRHHGGDYHPHNS